MIHYQVLGIDDSLLLKNTLNSSEGPARFFLRFTIMFLPSGKYVELASSRRNINGLTDKHITQSYWSELIQADMKFFRQQINGRATGRPQWLGTTKNI